LHSIHIPRYQCELNSIELELAQEKHHENVNNNGFKMNGIESMLTAENNSCEERANEHQRYIGHITIFVMCVITGILGQST
jgi:hypothetical protein